MNLAFMKQFEKEKGAVKDWTPLQWGTYAWYLEERLTKIENLLIFYADMCTYWPDSDIFESDIYKDKGQKARQYFKELKNGQRIAEMEK